MEWIPQCCQTAEINNLFMRFLQHNLSRYELQSKLDGIDIIYIKIINAYLLLVANK